jgi:alpha-tubulin suppressor-like RCC1 family protein
MSFLAHNRALMLVIAVTSLSATGCLRSLTAGSGHMCVLKGEGAYCWGLNTVGQFGNGTTTSSLTPVRAADRMRLKSVEASAATSCGLDAKGAAFCWGDNTNGQLGKAQGNFLNTPTAIAGNHAFVKISTGNTGACALTKDGQAYCWGDNGNGQIGQGTLTGPDVCPSGRPCYLAPTAVGGNLAFAKISAHESARCGITIDKKVYCWGNPEFRQIGLAPQGSTLPAGSTSSPLSVPVGTDLKVSTVTVGVFNACAIAEGGPPYCWGIQFLGDLGANASVGACNLTSPPNPPCSPTPVAVEGSLRLAPYEEAFGATTVACGLTRDGAAFCWGNNKEGELGNGSTVDYSQTPAAVSGGLHFREIAVGGALVCAVTHGDRIYCWGTDYQNNRSNVPKRLK